MSDRMNSPIRLAPAWLDPRSDVDEDDGRAIARSLSPTATSEARPPSEAPTSAGVPSMLWPPAHVVGERPMS